MWKYRLHPGDRRDLARSVTSETAGLMPSRMGIVADNLAGTHPNYKRNALISATVFAGATAAVYIPRYFDLPLEAIVNRYSGKSVFLDTFFFDFDTYFTLSGAVLVALIWSCWFGGADLEARTRMLVGTLMSVGAGAVSRFLQHELSSHPRPLYDRALGFHIPSVPNQTPFNTWDSFPSDHAAVFCGLAIVIFLARPKLGWAAFAWMVLLELSRAYMGAHYPTDLIGGAALGAFFVWLAQAPAVIRYGRRLALWERSSPSYFYMGAFFVTYQIATLLQDLRSMAGGVHLIREIERLIVR